MGRQTPLPWSRWACAAATPPLLGLLLWDYKRSTEFLPEMPNLSGVVALVTGATSGLGLQTAKGLVWLGAHVIMTARSAAKGQQALDLVLAGAPPGTAEVEVLDLACEASVRACAARLLARGMPLHTLVLNAGAFLTTDSHTWGGRESQIGINHFSHVLLTRLLLPLLPLRDSRIVIVSSRFEALADMRRTRNFEDLGQAGSAGPECKIKNYALSKAYNLVWGLELAERLQGRVAVVVTQPGATKTNLHQRTDRRSLSGCASSLLMALTLQGEQEGALSQLWAACAPLEKFRSGSTLGPNLFNLGSTSSWQPSSGLAAASSAARDARRALFEATDRDLFLHGCWSDDVGTRLSATSKL